MQQDKVLFCNKTQNIKNVKFDKSSIVNHDQVSITTQKKYRELIILERIWNSRSRPTSPESCIEFFSSLTLIISGDCSIQERRSFLTNQCYKSTRTQGVYVAKCPFSNIYYSTLGYNALSHTQYVTKNCPNDLYQGCISIEYGITISKNKSFTLCGTFGHKSKSPKAVSLGFSQGFRSSNLELNNKKLSMMPEVKLSAMDFVNW